MRPGTEAELAEIVRGANGPLLVRGGGTRTVGRPSAAGEVVETGGLAGVVLYEPGALTLVARAGTPLAEVEALLAAEGQRLAFEPPDWRGLLGRAGMSTLGGVVAANASGPRRVQAGAARDFALGVRFVDGRGAVVANGGRVMKNVTGYDLVKLLAGSRGVLGILTEVSLKVLPAPEAEATLVATGLGPAAAVAALARALGSPFDVSGAAHTPAGETLVRIEGLAGSVGYRAGRLAALLGSGWDRVEDAASAARWRAVRDVAAFHGAGGALWRLHLKPSDAPAVVAAVGGGQALYDWGGGLVWLHLAEPRAEAVRAAVAAAGGHATLWRGEGGPVFPPETPAVAALSAGLRRQFDPRGILNAGLMEV
jgi:glycolate oxidase FAD binding subunit